MSYYRVLGLDSEPFSTSPDPAFFYQSQTHRAILANLLIEFRLRRGLSVVIGDIGIGKTTLGRKLIQMLKSREGMLFHLILDPTYPTEEQFFSALIRTLGIEGGAAASSVVEHREILERYLFRTGIREHQTVILVIDEAHKLNTVSLEALRILLNYETNNTKLLQLVLLGQMELLPVIAGMPNLMDRISLKCTMEPLNLVEMREMITFRLREAGYQSRLALFTDDAIEEIYEYSEGYPRRIAMLCHKALRALVMDRGRAVEAAHVEALIQQDLDGGWPLPRRLQRSNSSA